MKLSILHLSDIHFKNNGINFVSEKIEQIASAVDANLFLQSSEVLLIVVTGDIAFSGKVEEYNLAKSFFNRLENLLIEKCKFEKIVKVTVPGNHDCDFSNKETTLREMVLSDFQKNLKDQKKVAEAVNFSTKIQENYFAFEGEIEGTENEFHYLAKSRKVSHGNFNIEIRKFNTAWCSMRNENQGGLIFPVGSLNEINFSENADLVISLFHHPYNWLESNNSRDFKKYIEKNSDIVLTGHEHIADNYQKRGYKGEELTYIEGGVLQDGSKNNSAFNFINIDLMEKAFSFKQMLFVDESYQEEDVNEKWIEFKRNPHRSTNNFIFTQEFEAFLKELGIGLTHKKREEIFLDDLFIFPNFEKRKISKKNFSFNNVEIEGKKIFDEIIEEKTLIINGEDSSGKTTLAKKLILGLNKEFGFVSVMISAKIIFQLKNNQIKENIVRELVEKQFKKQYNRDQFEKFKNLSSDKKVIIIDDLDFGLGNLERFYQIIPFLKKSFETILIFSTKYFELGDLVIHAPEKNPFFGFTPLEIKPFGHLLRSKLISKWIDLDSDEISSTDRVYKQNNLENTITALIKEDILPSYPFVILTLLQNSELSNNQINSSGTYAHLYTALINASLFRENSDPAQISIKLSFLSFLAFRMFTYKTDFLSEDQVTIVIDEFKNRFHVTFTEEMLRTLEKSKILEKRSEGFKFVYRYCYYYFVAQYFHANIRNNVNSELKNILFKMVSKTYFDDYFQIILFYIYLSTDLEVIDRLIQESDTFFTSYSQFDFKNDFSFINGILNKQLEKETPVLNTNNSISDNRDNHHKELDKQKKEEDSSLIKLRSVDTNEQEFEINELLKVNLSLRKIDLLGQILKNFQGSIEGDLKIKITTSAYSLGLRLLKYIFTSFEQNFDIYKEFVSSFVNMILPDESETRRNELINKYIIYFMSRWSHGIVKRLSTSCGHEQLKMTYEEIQKLSNKSKNEIPIAVSLIQLSIKLDHFKGTPLDEMKRLKNDLKNNPFANQILRQLVYDYLYLFPCEGRLVQQISAHFDIRLNTHKGLPDGLVKEQKSQKKLS